MLRIFALRIEQPAVGQIAVGPVGAVGHHAHGRVVGGVRAVRAVGRRALDDF